MDSDDYYPSIVLQTVYEGSVWNFAILFCIMLLLLLVSGWIAAGERALFSLSVDETNEIREEKSTRDKFIRQLSDRAQQIRTAVSIVQTILIVAVTIIGMYTVQSVCSTARWTEGCVAGIFGIGLLLFVFKGWFPKFLTQDNHLRVARTTAPFLKTIDWICRPVSLWMYASPAHQRKHDSQLNESTIISKETADEKEMLEEIVHFYNKTADEIMVPRLDMKAINAKCSFKEALDIIIRSGFSRIPIYEETEDNVTGVLYAKDLLPYIQDTSDFEWQKLIRPAYFVPETKKIEGLLEEFRTNRVHIAIVVDEFGCTSGLVTMEDIIEEIVGDISDEYDTDAKQYFQLPDGSYIFEGKIQLNDFFRETDIDEEEFGDLTEDIETLTGLLLKIKGTLPRRREMIEYRNYRFRVLEADERRVVKVKFDRIPPAPGKEK
ncbi:transporter associated domain-containing protein [Tannerella forsythia]|uniref:transporter associated domain-containing protein n=1 Tax=Tannerella forsythia TaxID=28112 RepID=UPI0021AB3513|nr:transporter associated domain-containing protein [Tannerella forsythia]